MYNLVYCIDRPNNPDALNEVRKPAKWLGISHHVSSDMCYWLITDSGKLILKNSVEHVIRDDYLNREVKKQIDKFNENLDKRLDKKNFIFEENSYFVDLEYDDDDHNHGVMTN